jgi:hypothetical protein
MRAKPRGLLETACLNGWPTPVNRHSHPAWTPAGTFLPPGLGIWPPRSLRWPAPSPTPASIPFPNPGTRVTPCPCPLCFALGQVQGRKRPLAKLMGVALWCDRVPAWTTCLFESAYHRIRQTLCPNRPNSNLAHPRGALRRRSCRPLSPQRLLRRPDAGCLCMASLARGCRFCLLHTEQTARVALGSLALWTWRGLVRGLYASGASPWLSCAPRQLCMYRRLWSCDETRVWTGLRQEAREADTLNLGHLHRS